MPDSRHGHFHWNELLTRNVGKAKDFYAQTLGWSYEPFPMADGEYTVCKSGDEVVGGIFEMSDGQGFDGVPDHWFAYITVDDVDKRLQEVAAAGGTIRATPSTYRMSDASRSSRTSAHIGWITPAQQG